eukprot:1247607-Pleurochrysis_carterae.AAC.1
MPSPQFAAPRRATASIKGATASIKGATASIKGATASIKGSGAHGVRVRFAHDRARTPLASSAVASVWTTLYRMHAPLPTMGCVDVTLIRIASSSSTDGATTLTSTQRSPILPDPMRQLRSTAEDATSALPVDDCCTRSDASARGALGS